MIADKLNIDKLINLVERDNEDSNTKRAAELLIAAMNDWPTFNQTDLYEFLKEFNAAYGNRFTVEELKNRSTKDNWKEEAKWSVIKMLELDKTKDFDRLVEEILTKYIRR